METLNRKNEHILLALRSECQMDVTTWLECVLIVHQALPKCSLKDIDTSITLFGRKFSLPLMINAITGGTEKAKQINERLATVAHEFNIPLMLGSIRPALECKEALESYSVARKFNDIFLIINIGIAQLNKQNMRKIVDLAQELEANAIAIHLNALQESLQPEGDTFSGEEFVNKLNELKEESKLPIIVKEVGCGISYEVAEILCNAKIDAIDVEGAGGTSFAYIEGLRAKRKGNDVDYEIAMNFKNWGIPTAASILEVKKAIETKNRKIHLIAGGGIQTGIDGMKAIALGADAFAMARKFLIAAVNGIDALRRMVMKIQKEIKIILYLSGTKNITEFTRKREKITVILDPLKTWINQRLRNATNP